MMGLYFLNRADYAVSINHVVERLKQQVNYAFAADGVHKENSIDYHYIVLDLLLGCRNFLQYIEHPYYAELCERMNAAEEYMVYALKPNLKRPLLGDSKGEPVQYMKQLPAYIKTFDNSYLEYVATQGKAGKCPPDLFKRFSSGYVFMRQHFNPANYQDSTWLSFKAGFSTRVHKHQDDLSICLFSKGHDIFVDPGMYSYVYGNPRKEYMESLPAHTTICVKNRAYRKGSGNGWAFKIQYAQRRSGYDYTMASSRGYDGIAIYRHLYYLRQMDILVIWDECISYEENTYAQYFHLGQDMRLPQELNCHSVDMTIRETPYVVTLQQLKPVDNLTLLSGEKTQPMSILSAGFNRCLDSNTLEYTNTASSSSFISVVDIHRCEDSPCRCVLSDSALIIEKLGRKIELPLEETVPVSFGDVTTSVLEGSKLIISNESSGFTKHAVYVYNNVNNNIEKYEYTSEKEFEVDMEGIQDGVLVYFVSNNTGETLKGILGRWKTGEMETEGTFCQYPELLVPKVHGIDVDSSKSPEYTFRINADDIQEADISWWIYRNGALFENTQNKNKQFRAVLTVPGEYVVMCSMRNKYFGEFFFDQFEKIVVE